MRKLLRAVALILMLISPLSLFVQAAEKNEISITWLSADSQPKFYNSDLNWISCDTGGVYDLSSGKRIDEYRRVEPTSEDLICAAKYDADGNQKWGYLDKTGAVTIPLKYDRAYGFSEGLALVVKYDQDGNRKCGYIDKTGAEVIPLEYDGARNFSESLAVVAKKDAEGKPKYGYINMAGTVIVPLEYDSANDFSDGLANVGNKWMCGFIDRIGTVIIPLEYNYAIAFSEDLALVSKDNADGEEKWSYIDRTGNEIIPPLEFAYAGDFSDGLARVTKKDINGEWKYGYIDKAGTVVIPLEYDNFYYVHGSDGDCGTGTFCNFFDGLACVTKKDAGGNVKWGCIDKTGTAIIPFEYDCAVYEGHDGLIGVGKDSGDGIKFGFVDRAGTIVLPLDYDHMGRIYDSAESATDIYWVRRGLSYGVFKLPDSMDTAAPETAGPVEDSLSIRSGIGASALPPTTPDSGMDTNAYGSETGNHSSALPIIIVTVAAVAIIAALLVLKRKHSTSQQGQAFAPASAGQQPMAETNAPPETRRCPNCGKAVALDSRVCPACGASFDSRYPSETARSEPDSRQ